jgi:hypothetical protein
MELNAIIQRYHERSIEQYGSRPQSRHYQAFQAAAACRTERYGEMQFYCQGCDAAFSLYHSCGHRSYPRCRNHDNTRWLERQQLKLLPVDYFMVTFTLPYGL